MLDRPDLAKYPFISRSTLKHATFMEQELALHEVFAWFQRVGYVTPYYDAEAIRQDFNFIEMNNKAYFNGVYSKTIRGSPKQLKAGRAIIETYFDIGDMERSDSSSTLRHAFKTDKILYYAIQHLIRNTRFDLSVGNLFKVLYGLKYGPIYPSPIFYKVLLSHLCKPMGRTISDSSPRLGIKAMAAAALGAKYVPLTDELDEAIANGFATAIDLNLVEQPAKHDILLLDNGLKPVDMEWAVSQRGSCKDLLVFVPADQAEEAKRKYKPTRMVRIRTQAVTAKLFTPDYMFLFQQP